MEGSLNDQADAILEATPELEGKVAVISESLGLDATLSITSAIRAAQEEVGCEAVGNLSEQSDALLNELLPI